MFKNVFIFLLEYPFVSAESHRLKIYDIMEFIYTQDKTTILSIIYARWIRSVYFSKINTKIKVFLLGMLPAIK